MFRISLILSFLLPFFVQSQKGIIPFTGITFESHGITAEEIDATLNGDTWTSNRLPVNAEMKIRAIKPRGFVAEDGVVFPGVQVIILTMSNDTLANIENIMGEQSLEGFDSTYLSKLSVTLTFDPANSKPGDSLRIISRFYDTKGTADLWTKLELVIAEESLPLEITNSTSSIRVLGQYKVMCSGLEMDDVSALVRETTGFNKPSEEIRFGKITGLTPEEFNEGSVSLFTYDTHLNKKPCALTYINAVKGSNEKEIMLNLTIPVTGDFRFIRVRWESKDKQKVFDLVTVI